MSPHPTIPVPGLGELDHAWDLLGAWHATLTVPLLPDPIGCRLEVRSWEHATLTLEAELARQLGWPTDQPLTRVAPVVWAEDGGGALAFTLEGAMAGPLLATFWPGELQIRSLPDAAVELTLTARRDRAYYLAKYPVEAS